MDNPNILISEHFFLDLTFLKIVRQNISHSISLFLMIIDLKLVLQELLGLANLVRAQNFHIYELAEVIIDNKDEKHIFAAF